MWPTRKIIGCCALHPERLYQTLREARALLFDLDGTLVAPTIDFGVLNQAARDVVLAYGAGEALVGTQPALEMIDTAARWLEVHGVGGAEALRRDGRHAILAVELAAAERAMPFAGVPEMLRVLEASGLQVGIVTRNCREAAARIVAQGDLACGVLLSRDDVVRVKPDPAHLLTALERLSVPANRALMCGDHAMDMVAGKRAGAGAVGVLTGGAQTQDLLDAGADLVLERITDLAAYLAGAA